MLLWYSLAQCLQHELILHCRERENEGERVGRRMLILWLWLCVIMIVLLRVDVIAEDKKTRR